MLYAKDFFWSAGSPELPAHPEGTSHVLPQQRDWPAAEPALHRHASLTEPLRLYDACPAVRSR